MSSGVRVKAMAFARGFAVSCKFVASSTLSSPIMSQRGIGEGFVVVKTVIRLHEPWGASTSDGGQKHDYAVGSVLPCETDIIELVVKCLMK